MAVHLHFAQGEGSIHSRLAVPRQEPHSYRFGHVRAGLEEWAGRNRGHSIVAFSPIVGTARAVRDAVSVEPFLIFGDRGMGVQCDVGQLFSGVERDR